MEQLHRRERSLERRKAALEEHKKALRKRRSGGKASADQPKHHHPNPIP